MASNREERMQQRLRGAQRRQVKEVDFGLSFPSVTSRTTPQPELAARISARRTPGSKRRGRPSNAALAEASKPPTHSASNANISAKRRKLDSDEADPSSSTRSTRSSLHQPRLDIYALPEDEELIVTRFGSTTNGSVEQRLVEPQGDPALDSIPRLRTARSPSLPARVVEEVTESPTDAPGSGHRKRVGLEAAVQSSQLQDVLQMDTPVAIGRAMVGSPVSRSKRKRGAATPNKTAPPAKQSSIDSRSQAEVVSDDIDELSPEQPQATSNLFLSVEEDFDEEFPNSVLRHGRRSRRGDEFDEIPREQSIRRVRKPRSISAKEVVGHEDEINSEPVEAEEINDQEAAIILKKNRGRGFPRNMLPSKSPDLDKVTGGTPLSKKKRTKKQASTPAVQRHPKTSKDKFGTKGSKKQSNGPGNSTELPIPVTVHRMTKRIMYDEDERDADILNSDIPYAKRGGVNPIDVLSELCREIIGAGLHRLEEDRENSDDPAVRREYSTKWRAVEAFGNELQVQLLEHTINLDNTFSLERRVRDEQKKKLRLREDILRVRKDREQVALRMDEIRIKHENETNTAQKRDALNNNIHDIELAIEQAKEQQPHSAKSPVKKIGIELLLKRVAGRVSNESDLGGTLRQIKDFNAFLERAALALEARRA